MPVAADRDGTALFKSTLNRSAESAERAVVTSRLLERPARQADRPIV